MKDRTRKFALGAIFAAIAGYVAGILTAPKSGKQTRADIKDAAVEAEKKLKALHSELGELLDDVKDRGTKLKDKAQVEFKEALDKAQVAKQKAREMLSALHEGGADDKDLKKAVSDASSAIAHLKSFLRHDG